MLPGETILSGASKEEGVSEFTVLRSAAGFYIGTTTEDGFPYTRETGYFESKTDAELVLEEYKNTGNLAYMRA
jgi:nucleoside-diphosphate-sugar epimerase